MTIKTSLIIPLLFLNLLSCNPPENKDSYELALNEEFDLYSNENTCCQTCFINESTLNNVKMIGISLVKDAPNDCDGCTSVLAWKFKALAIGTDTIKIGYIGARGTCDSVLTNAFRIEKYIVIVK